MSVTCCRSLVFSGYSGSYTNKTDCHDIVEILLKVALNTITLTLYKYSLFIHGCFLIEVLLLVYKWLYLIHSKISPFIIMIFFPLHSRLKTCTFNNDLYIIHNNYICGVMVSVLASSVLDRRFQLRLGQTKDFKICICCFFTKEKEQRLVGSESG